MSENLDTLRLPELWTLFAEVTGAPTRCPNRAWLLRKIAEARAAHGAPGQAPEVAQVTNPKEAATTGPSASVATDAAHVSVDALDAPAGAPIDPSTLPDGCGLDPAAAGLAIHTADDFGNEDGDEPAANIAPSLMAATEVASTSASHDDAAPDPMAATLEADGPKLTKLSVDELRLLYRRLIGRETASTAKAYLVWKLRQAMNGKIKLGAIERAAKPEGDTADVVVLPLRMARHEVEELDKVWHVLGFPSRTAFLRRAIAEYAGQRVGQGDARP